MYRASLGLLSSAILALVVTCSAQTPSTDKPKFTPIPGYDPSTMDTTADPCVNFYQYACGNFAKVHPIPGDLPAFSPGANLYEINTQLLHGIVEKAASGGVSRSANEQKIGDFYQSCMNTDVIDKQGIAPLQPELDRIAALSSKQQLPELVARLNKISVGVFLDFGSLQDFKDATQQIAYIDQGGLGLPEKDYYLRDDAKSKETRAQYVAHLANMLKLLGESQQQAEAHAKKIMELETALAKSSAGVVERRDPEKIYHMMTLTEFSKLAPGIETEKYMKWIGSPSVDRLNVISPDFFKAFDQTIQQTDLDTIKAYLRVHLADSFSARLPKAFDEEHFDFFGRKLEGTPEQQARWKRCVNSVDASLGEALGQLYVQQYFPPDMKAKSLDYVHGIEAAMEKDLDQLDWMSADTKIKAKEKLHAVANKIGYPDKWRDYSSLEIKPGDALGNSVRAREFENAYQLNKIGKPIDRGEWGMTPPTVNAYYNPSMNDINFPAGILEPPYFDKNASDATNFGQIGAVVGHELTHGFDDQGAKFDGKGNLHDWWTAEDKTKFEAKTKCLEDEYSQFAAVDDVKVNGKLTLGENTADNGGLRLALMAMLANAAKTGVDLSQKTNGYTPEQQFFIGYGQSWCSNERPEYLRMTAQTDPHSPDAIRVSGVIVNTPEFAKVFGCKVKQPMAPVKSCRVW